MAAVGFLDIGLHKSGQLEGKTTPPLHLNRQDEHRPAVLIQPPLQFKHSVIVQPARQHVFILEHQLPGEKLRLRKAFARRSSHSFAASSATSVPTAKWASA